MVELGEKMKPKCPKCGVENPNECGGVGSMAGQGEPHMHGLYSGLGGGYCCDDRFHDLLPEGEFDKGYDDV